MLVTKNMTPGESVYGEKRISVETTSANNASAVNGEVAPATKTEYRVWNPFRSKLAAGILGGLDDLFIRPGSKVLYLGAASGTSVSHVADIVGPTGTVFAVEFSHRSGRDLINMATHRTNVIPIIEDARHPLRYRMLVSMVDVIFADVAQPDQARIVGLNAHLYLKVGGAALVSIKANCIDSTAAPEAVFAREVQKMRDERLKPLEQLTLEPFERGESSLLMLRVLLTIWQITALWQPVTCAPQHRLACPGTMCGLIMVLRAARIQTVLYLAYGLAAVYNKELCCEVAKSAASAQRADPLVLLLLDLEQKVARWVET